MYEGLEKLARVSPSTLRKIIGGTVGTGVGLSGIALSAKLVNRAYPDDPKTVAAAKKVNALFDKLKVLKRGDPKVKGISEKYNKAIIKLMPQAIETSKKKSWPLFGGIALSGATGASAGYGVAKLLKKIMRK